MLDSVVRRPQRLLFALIAFMVVLFFTTYLSLSSWGSEQVRTHFESLKAAFNKNATQAAPQIQDDVASIAGSGKPSHTFMDGIKTIDDLRPFAVKGKDGNLYPPQFVPHEVNKMPRAKAGFIVLVRNSELEDMRKSMRDVEDRFNRKYGYPWIFLNNEPFTEEFKQGVKKMTRSEVRFGFIGPEMWGYPDWINQTYAAEQRKKMTEEQVIYGWSESYRHMCRFQSGFFWRHNLTMDLDYYWRVEPGIKLFCDMDYDPFVFMELNNKKYGFTISLHEYSKTIPTLWDQTKEFMKKHPDYYAKDHALHFMTDEPEKLLEPGYNMCHFWSNFEIADLRFWRSKQYREYFDHLDKAGGFFYERWGDAPVHSIAAVLFLNRSQIHHFNDIGYYHGPWTHCPMNKAQYHDNGKCICNPEDVCVLLTQSADYDNFMCMKEWWRTSIEGDANKL
ncbi:hypothetical protein MOBT1_001878 [Malassezia obtusa]|uniref:Glycolipid 2-alpha-mannosyltransferase n=1 Tax=Malassezia obtusa TaxID=76774 RepID=A0AAF0E034_9BASI|nr:hypothetical protein MOBT1_001878 [Malassezia obtusa]